MNDKNTIDSPLERWVTFWADFLSLREMIARSIFRIWVIIGGDVSNTAFIGILYDEEAEKW